MSEEGAILWAICASVLLIFTTVGLFAMHSENSRRLEEIKCDHRGGVLLLESGDHTACVRRDSIISYHDQSEHAQ